MREKIASTEFAIIILGCMLVLAPKVFSGSISGGNKYNCSEQQYTIVDNATKVFHTCLKCKECELGSELIVPCNSTIGLYVQTGDCKLCDPGFYHDKKDTQQCKKCERSKCFEHQVGEGKCPTKENQDGSYCINKCKNGYIMNENGTKCHLDKSQGNATLDRTTVMPILSSSVNVLNSTAHPQEKPTTNPKMNPISKPTLTKSMNPVTHATNPTPYLNPKHTTINPEKSPTTNFTTNFTQKYVRNNTKSVINDTTDALLNHSGAMPVKWIAIIILFVVSRLFIMIIWKHNSIREKCTRLKEKCHKQQNYGSNELENNELLKTEIEKNSDKERKNDESIKIPEQEEKGETDYPKDSVQESSFGRTMSDPKCQHLHLANTTEGRSEMQNPSHAVASVNVNISTTGTGPVNINVRR